VESLDLILNNMTQPVIDVTTKDIMLHSASLIYADFREGKDGQYLSQNDFCPSKLQLTLLYLGNCMLMKFLAAFKAKCF